MNLRIGMVLPCALDPREIASLARLLDDAIDSLWVWDDLGYNGAIAQASLALAATEHATVGIGITPACFHHPASAAMEYATLASAFPGRFIVGLGHGVQRWMAQLGEVADSPLDRLREVHQSTVALLAGETVTSNGNYVTLEMVGLNRPPPSVPVYIGARGQATIRYAGQAADGMVAAEWAAPSSIARIRQQLRADQPLVAYLAADTLDPASAERRLAEQLQHVRQRPDLADQIAPGQTSERITIDHLREASALNGGDAIHQTTGALMAAGATEVVLVAQSRKLLADLPALVHDLKTRITDPSTAAPPNRHPAPTEGARP